jgi:hypothetical protein
MYKEEQELATLTLTPTAAAVFSNPIEAQTLGLTEAQSEIVMSAYDDANNGDRTKYYPHYVMSANESTNKLRLDLRAAAITFTMDFQEYMHLIARPVFEGRIEGLEIYEAGIVSVQEKVLLGEEIDQLEAGVTCYQLNDDGKRIEHAHDIEIMVNWHSSMTKTSDYRIIENLFHDMNEVDFSADKLNEALAVIGNTYK